MIPYWQNAELWVNPWLHRHKTAYILYQFSYFREGLYRKMGLFSKFYKESLKEFLKFGLHNRRKCYKIAGKVDITER